MLWMKWRWAMLTVQPAPHRVGHAGEQSDIVHEVDARIVDASDVERNLTDGIRRLTVTEWSGIEPARVVQGGDIIVLCCPRVFPLSPEIPTQSVPRFSPCDLLHADLARDYQRMAG